MANQEQLWQLAQVMCNLVPGRKRSSVLEGTALNGRVMARKHCNRGDLNQRARQRKFPQCWSLRPKLDEIGTAVVLTALLVLYLWKVGYGWRYSQVMPRFWKRQSERIPHLSDRHLSRLLRSEGGSTDISWTQQNTARCHGMSWQLLESWNM